MIEFSPGDGTCYTLHLIVATYGGTYIICNETSLWRYHRGDQLKFCCGNDNPYTYRAIWNYLENMDIEKLKMACDLAPFEFHEANQ